MKERLDDFVTREYGPLLQKLTMKHIGYLVDEQNFGNEFDRYANDKISLQFVMDRGEEFIQLFSARHPGDLFSLEYLVGLLAPDTRDYTPRESLVYLAQAQDRFYLLFEAKYYTCFRRAYRLYESCRNEELLK